MIPTTKKIIYQFEKKFAFLDAYNNPSIHCEFAKLRLAQKL